MAVRRGKNINAPLVACLINRNGSELSKPVYRDAADKKFTIVGEAKWALYVNDDQLYDLDAPNPNSSAVVASRHGA